MGLIEAAPRGPWRRGVRVIARLDVKGPNVIKGVQLEGLRVVGKPAELARSYYEQGADEILYLDVVASLYGRDNLVQILENASRGIFVPLTAGGGVRSLSDIEALLRAGADKVAINTAATKNPELIREASRRFGSQCVVLSIEAKRIGDDRWEAYTDNGRERTGLDAVEWARRAVELGAGEILLTSVDREGTRRGYDVELTRRVAADLPVPLIASGGAGSDDHVATVIREGGADAVAVAAILHYRARTLPQLKFGLTDRGIGVRS